MKKYRKKPVVIEAMKLSKENINDVLSWMGGLGVTSGGIDRFENAFISINTLEGIMLAIEGDYIIRGVKNELYPCKPDIFEMTYEEIE